MQQSYSSQNSQFYETDNHFQHDEKHFQQQQQQNTNKIPIYTDYNYNKSDEAEIVKINENKKEYGQFLNFDSEIKQNYLNCVSKSPELFVSDVKENFQYYDDTIRELKHNIVKKSSKTPEPEIEKTHEFQVVQRKIKENVNKIDKKMDSVVEMRKPFKIENVEVDEEIDYKKIPVRDLIHTFEKQQKVMGLKLSGDILPALSNHSRSNSIKNNSIQTVVMQTETNNEFHEFSSSSNECITNQIVSNMQGKHFFLCFFVICFCNFHWPLLTDLFCFQIIMNLEQFASQLSGPL